MYPIEEGEDRKMMDDTNHDALSAVETAAKYSVGDTLVCERPNDARSEPDVIQCEVVAVEESTVVTSHPHSNVRPEFLATEDGLLNRFGVQDWHHADEN